MIYEYEAFLAGIWATVGSTLGKLSGTESVVGESYIIYGCLLVTMVLSNTWGCRHYLRSLDAASNSVSPTVISSASSFMLSGAIGMILFNEVVTVWWWLGSVLITAGLALLASPNPEKVE